MQLPRLAVLLAVYSGVQATLAPDEPTGKPDMKSETNQTGASRFLGMPSISQQYGSASYGPQMSSGLGFMSQPSQPLQPLQPLQPQQIFSQPQLQPQPQFRAPIQSSPYRPSGQFSPYSGLGGGTIEQNAPPIVDDQAFSSSNGKYSFQGGSANSGFGTGSLGGLGGLSGLGLPQTLTLYGNIPVTVSGTLNFGVRGQLTVAQDGVSGSAAAPYEGTPQLGPSYGTPQLGSSYGSQSVGLGVGGSYQPYQGSSAGTISGFSGASQSGMAYNRQPYQQQIYGRPLPYQPGPLSTNAFIPGIGGSIGTSGAITSSGSTYSKTQTEESGQMQVQGQTQMVYGSGGSQTQNMVPSYQGGAVSSYSPNLGQSGFQKQGPMNSMAAQGMSIGQTLGQSLSSSIQSMPPVQYQIQRQVAPSPGQQQYNSPRYSEVVARALNDEPADKPES